MEPIEFPVRFLPGAPEAIERASDADREYFAENPDEAELYREAFDGEWSASGPFPGSLVVLVTQLRPGFRIRQLAYIALTAEDIQEGAYGAH